MVDLPSHPKPNTLALSWFYGEHQKGTLDLTPKYQRNPIWSKGQKCFLIDSLISGCPIPQVYINVLVKGKGPKKTTTYEVVDGQQRLRTILEYINDEWPLVEITSKSYPVSKYYTPYTGRHYSELPDQIQNMIWDYQLAVQELRGLEEKAIRDLFRRLNYVVERLNRQELRHSQYFGEFNEAVESLAADSFWDDANIFTRRDFQRMKDIEFVSELFLVVIDGIQDGQKTIDRFYADNDVSFPGRSRYTSKFRQTIASLRSVLELIKGTRFKKKADFYALFVAALSLNQSTRKPRSLNAAVPQLETLDRALDRDPQKLRGTAREYYSTVIEGPNKLAKRRRRAEILLGLMDL